MPTPPLWYDKAQLAVEAARRELDADNLPAAANRAYFALHAFLTGVFINAGQQPPEKRENWPHAGLGDLVRLHFKTSFYKRLMMSLLFELRQARIYADYGDHLRLTREKLGELLRGLAQVLASRER
jgi:uncharacterized protein (UPF0332 family)